jgi:exosortase/archaeosortase family protein
MSVIHHQSADDENPSQPESEQGPQQEPRAARGRVLRFIVTFFVIALLLLGAWNYSTESKLVDWYLFHVARHTAWVLDLIGYSADVESTTLRTDDRTTLYMREAVAAWEAGRTAPSRREVEAPADGDVAPLERWERFRYRMLRKRRNLEAQRHFVAQLRAIPERQVASIEEFLAAARDTLDKVVAAHGMDGPYRDVASPVPEAAPHIEAARRLIQTVEGNAELPDDEAVRLLTEANTRLVAAQEALGRTLTTRLARAEETESGPAVSFTATRGAQIRTGEIREAMQRLRAGETLEGEYAGLTQAALQAELQEEQQKLRDARRLLQLEQQIEAIEDGDAELAAGVTLEALRDEHDELRDRLPDPHAVIGRSFPFNVVPDCGAIPSISIFVAAVIAFPARVRSRVLGVLLGVPILYGVNIARLACLAVIGAYDTTPGHEIFTFVHEYLWQGIYVVFVVIVWLLWVELFVKERKGWAKSAPA